MVEQIYLGKLLKLIFLDHKRCKSEVKRSILQRKRSEERKKAGEESPGGNFYVPFWSDAKDHVLGKGDLVDMVKGRISSIKNTEKLYPVLMKGFLNWFNDWRRRTNAPFLEVKRNTLRLKFPDLDGIIKVDNFLSIEDGRGIRYIIYPYFAKKPHLSNDAARLGLWVLTKLAKDIFPENLIILDVMRGKAFSLDKVSFSGNEGEEIRSKFSDVLEIYNIFKSDFE